jgi:hypothetical protein
MTKKDKFSPSIESAAAKTPGFRRQLIIISKELEIPILIILGLGSVVLGTIGFQKYFEVAHIASNFGTSLYNSIGLLQLKNGNINAPVLPIELEIARWLAPIVTTYSVLRGLWILFKKQIEILYLRIFIREHVIICGLGQVGLQLAKDACYRGQRVVVIEKTGSNPNIPACKETGAIIIIGDVEDPSILQKAGIKRASHVVAISGKDSTNAKIATNVRALVEKRNNKKNSDPIRCTIHIEDMRLWNVLRKQEFSIEKNPAFRLEIFNLYDEAAFQLLSAFPLVDPVKSNAPKPPHILIIGMGDMGERLSLHLGRQWANTYHKTQQKLHISVIDPDAKHKVDTLCNHFSLLNEVCRWDAYPIETHLPNYHPEGLVHSELSIVFICIGDEGAGTSAALSLLEHYSNPEMKIIVRVNEDKGLEMMLNEVGQAGELPGNLHFFEVLESTCRLEFLYDHLREMIAQGIHKEYVRFQLEDGESFKTNLKIVNWDVLEENDKQTNREQADHILAKLCSIHCDITPWITYGADQFLFKEDEIEILAKLEHERWCQQKTAQGWTYAPDRVNLKRKHPDLLNWDDPKFSEAAKDKDRNAVREIPKLLAQAGFQIQRLPR